MQAMQWGMNPYAVAQKTHLVNGVLGYEAQLVNAVIASSSAIHGRFHYRYGGDYGRSQMKETYTVQIEGVKVWVEVVNRKASYVATAMTGMRRLRALPGQVA